MGPLGAAVLAGPIGRRLEKVQTGVHAGRVDVVVPGKETHGDDDDDDDYGAASVETGGASKYMMLMGRWSCAC